MDLFQCTRFCGLSGNKLPTQWHNADGKKWKEGHRVKVTHPKVRVKVIHTKELDIVI